MGDKGEERLYTPIVLRTGFMHSYRRTIGLLLFAIILEAVFWTLAGFWPRFGLLGLQRWGLLVILAIAVPIGTSTIRDIVDGYVNLFGVIDEDTERKLKLYRGLNRPSPETQNVLQQLFSDHESCAEFQRWIRRFVFDSTTDIVLLATIIPIIAVVISNTVYEKTILQAAVSPYPLLILEILIDAYATIFLILALSFILTFGFGYFITLNRLGRSKGDLGVWVFIQYLQGAPVKGRSVSSYWRFVEHASAIGRHFSGIAYRIVVIMTLGGLAQVLYNVSTSTIVTWFLAAIPVALSLIVLLLPLFSLHNVMHSAKTAVLRELEEEYDHLAMRFITHLTVGRRPQTPDRVVKADEEFAPKVASLKGIIEQTRRQSAWPVRAPRVLQIIVTSLIPVAYLFLEELLRALGLL